jgi:hypothetical protein
MALQHSLMRAFFIGLLIVFATSAIAPAQESSISVTVRNSDGSHAGNVPVTVYRIDALSEARDLRGETDDQGRLEVAVEPGGIYRVDVYTKQPNMFGDEMVNSASGLD